MIENMLFMKFLYIQVDVILVDSTFQSLNLDPIVVLFHYIEMDVREGPIHLWVNCFTDYF